MFVYIYIYIFKYALICGHTHIYIYTEVPWYTTHLNCLYVFNAWPPYFRVYCATFCHNYTLFRPGQPWFCIISPPKRNVWICLIPQGEKLKTPHEMRYYPNRIRCTSQICEYEVVANCRAYHWVLNFGRSSRTRNPKSNRPGWTPWGSPMPHPTTQGFVKSFPLMEETSHAHGISMGKAMANYWS